MGFFFAFFSAESMISREQEVDPILNILKAVGAVKGTFEFEVKEKILLNENHRMNKRYDHSRSQSLRLWNDMNLSLADALRQFVFTF